MPLKGFKHRWLCSMPCLSDKTFVTPQCDFLVPLHASHPSTSSGRGILATAGCKQSSSTLWVKMATDSFPSLVFVHGCDKSFYQKTSDGSKAPNGSSCDSGSLLARSAPFSNPAVGRMPGPLRRGRWRPMGAQCPQRSRLCLCLPAGPIRVLRRRLSLPNPWSPVAEYIFTRH